jgi:hypothetical protein
MGQVCDFMVGDLLVSSDAPMLTVNLKDFFE